MIRVRLLMWWHQDVLRHDTTARWGFWRCSCGKWDRWIDRRNP